MRGAELKGREKGGVGVVGLGVRWNMRERARLAEGGVVQMAGTEERGGVKACMGRVVCIGET